jgi:hypothetical protein
VSVFESDFKSIRCDFDGRFRWKEETLLRKRASEDRLQEENAKEGLTLGYMVVGRKGARAKWR